MHRSHGRALEYQPENQSKRTRFLLHWTPKLLHRNYRINLLEGPNRSTISTKRKEFFTMGHFPD